MKQAVIRTIFLMAVIFGFGVSYGQTGIATCPKKGTADCPLVQNCPKKGTKDCLYTTTLAGQTKVAAEFAACPYRGTAECPLLKNCPLKGTPDCPLTKKESGTSYASKKAAVKKKTDADLPACCRKAS